MNIFIDHSVQWTFLESKVANNVFGYRWFSIILVVQKVLNYYKNMLKLKTLDRNYRIFVSMGVCAVSKDNPLHKECCYILIFFAICLTFVATEISSLCFLYKYLSIDLTLSLTALCPAAAVFGTCSTMIITFYYRRDLLETFLGLQELHEKSISSKCILNFRYD